MQSIIDEILGKLKQDFIALFSGCPNIETVEGFAETKLKAAVVTLTEAYAREIDKELRKDRSGRRKAGLAVERSNDSRTILTGFGEVSYERTYYALRDGTYDYPIDRVLGVNPGQRISDSVTLRLANEAKEGSYARASRIVIQNAVSRETVMTSLRECRASEGPHEVERRVPVLHIDADEDHASMQNGRTRIVPLATVYEGLRTVGNGVKPRRECVNAFHHSALSAGEAFWEDLYDRIDSRYDIRDTKIYLHGDGAAWIRQGLEHFSNIVFVLDDYHKNKARQELFAGCKSGEAKEERQLLDKAFRTGDEGALFDVGRRMLKLHPEREGHIRKTIEYLYRNLDGISIRFRDAEARNGGATEPHVSHVLSQRLSSRPMGWSLKTLEHLVPILAAGGCELIPKEAEKELPECVINARENVSCRLRRKREYGADPDQRGNIQVIQQGKVTQLYCALRDLSR